MLKAEFGAADNPLIIGDVEIQCYVLDNGQRVLSQRGMYRALGMSGGSTKDGADRLVAFAAQERFNGLITSEIMAMIKAPIKFKVGGNVTYGYEATILVDICDAIIQARKEGRLMKQQEHIAENAEILIRGFAKTGIIALVDEVTGYQAVRERDELQKILKAYISAELLPWQKTFPDSFYKEIFRLNKWDFTVSGIKKRPGVVGKWTNRYIYEPLPKGVLEELKSNTPKSAAGNYTSRFFQSLTADTGHPHLNNQINQVIALMKASDNWAQFEMLFNKMIKRDSGQQELPFGKAAA